MYSKTASSSIHAAHRLSTKPDQTSALEARRPGDLAIAIRQSVSLLVIGLLFISLDHWILDVTKSEWFPGELRSCLNRLEAFGHAYGVFFIALTLAIVGQINRAQFTMLLCTSLGSGIAADIVKVFIGRIRPYDLPANSVGNSFLGIDRFWEAESFRELTDSALQSFPSAHTATAFGFAVGLSFLYPKGRWWFFSLAAMVGLQRVASRYHFVSDVIVGAGIGLIVATLILHRINTASQLGPLQRVQAVSE